MLESLLRAAQALRASDIHLSAGIPPMVRLDGALQALEATALGNAPIRAMIDSVLPESQRRQFADGAVEQVYAAGNEHQRFHGRVLRSHGAWFWASGSEPWGPAGVPARRRFGVKQKSPALARGSVQANGPPLTGGSSACSCRTGLR